MKSLFKKKQKLAVFTNSKFNDINSTKLFKEIKLNFFDIRKKNGNDSLEELYRDE